MRAPLLAADVDSNDDAGALTAPTAGDGRLVATSAVVASGAGAGAGGGAANQKPSARAMRGYDETSEKATKMKGLLIKVKLLLSFLQVLVSFRSTLSVGWPPGMQQLFDAFDFVNLDVLGLLRSGCAGEVSRGRG